MLESDTSTRMSQEVNTWLVNGVFHLLINAVYWGYNPLTNLLLHSWNIHVKTHDFQTKGPSETGSTALLLDM